MDTERQRRHGAAFAELHDGRGFVMPNAWDAGTAKVLADTGFSAIASTSAGIAFSLGKATTRSRPGHRV